jgi:hypothetical protein
MKLPASFAAVVSGARALPLVLALATGLAGQAAEPANPNSSPQTRTVLNYFHELSARKEGRRILFMDKQHIKGYDEIAALPKPFGFTEYGPHGSQNPPGTYDYCRFIEGLVKEFPRTCFFMCWNGKWSLASNENTKDLLNHPAVINRDDLPAGLVPVSKPQ